MFDFSSFLGGGNNSRDEPLSEDIEAPSGSSQLLHSDDEEDFVRHHNEEENVSSDNDDDDDESQSMLNSPEWEDEEDDDLYTMNSEMELIYFWQRANKMAFWYSIPMAAALISILLFNADSHEYSCQMPLRFWAEIECVLMLLCILVGLAFEYMIQARIHQLSQPDYLPEPTHIPLWRIYLCSRCTFALLILWMIVGAVWCFNPTAAATCRVLGLYQLTLALLYSQIAIVGFISLGCLGSCLTSLIFTFIYRTFMNPAPPTATQTQLEQLTKIIRPEDLPAHLLKQSCAICLESYDVQPDNSPESDSHVVELRQIDRCSHVFHKVCIDQWLLGNNRKCPLCRQSIERQSCTDREPVVDLEPLDAMEQPQLDEQV